MRHIGTLSDLREAQTFEDYLLTRGIKAKVEADDNRWAVWVFDEDNVETAKTELAEFRLNPNDTRYADIGKAAAKFREQATKQTGKANKNVVDVRRRWERPLSARSPVAFLLIMISVVVAVSSGLGESDAPIIDRLGYTAWGERGPARLQKEPREILNGEVWRIVTPMFIHFNFFHILFNMLWLRDLGSAIELRRGSLRFLILVLVIAAASNTAQYLYKGPYFGGMSGVVFGLFGYIWMKSRFDPEAGFYMPPNLVMWMIVWYVLCMTGLVGNIANMAHGIGLLTGVVIGYAPIAWRNLQRT